MMFDGMDFSFLYIVIPLVLFGPAMLGIVIIEVAADLIEDRGGRRTVAKAGIISIVAGYVVCRGHPGTCQHRLHRRIRPRRLRNSVDMPVHDHRLRRNNHHRRVLLDAPMEATVTRLKTLTVILG